MKNQKKSKIEKDVIILGSNFYSFLLASFLTKNNIKTTIFINKKALLDNKDFISINEKIKIKRQLNTFNPTFFNDYYFLTLLKDLNLTRKNSDLISFYDESFQFFSEDLKVDFLDNFLKFYKELKREFDEKKADIILSIF